MKMKYFKIPECPEDEIRMGTYMLYHSPDVRVSDKDGSKALAEVVGKIYVRVGKAIQHIADIHKVNKLIFEGIELARKEDEELAKEKNANPDTVWMDKAKETADKIIKGLLH